MTRLPSRFRRLDDALADLPGEEEPLYLTELDGLLTGVLASPAPIAPAVWLPLVWGGGPAPFEEADDSRWFGDMVLARHGEIARDLARGKPQPIFDVDERNGETLWEAWIEGFAMAMPLWPEDAPLAEGALAGLAEIELLIAVARDETELTSDEINRMCDEAPARIGGALVALSTTTVGRVAGSAPAAAAKPGRNDPCPCGSGKKYKRCCG